MSRIRGFFSNIRSGLINYLRVVRENFGLIIVLTILVYGAQYLYKFDWSGFGSHTIPNSNFVPAKTLWDWLGLLIIPAFLAIGGVWINATLRQIEREREEKRAETDREIADDRLKEQALQTYLDRMSEMLLKNQFDDPEVGEASKTVARARTLTVLRGLDSGRKSALIRFLSEAGLVTGDNKMPLIDLSTADLSETELSLIQLAKANLLDVNLERASLRGANLKGARLEGANLEGANLEGANLEKAYLQLHVQVMHLTGGDTRSTNLTRANLQNANLRKSFLSWVNLEGANLRGAHLESAHLEAANLTNAIIRQQQLDMAILDEYTVLPDGTHYKPPTTPPQDGSQ